MRVKSQFWDIEWLRNAPKIHEKVWASSPEVDELAEFLREAREKVYWKVKINNYVSRRIRL